MEFAGNHTGSHSLDEAVEHLKEAEVHLEEAREEEAKAERDIKEAIHEIEEASRHDEVEVHVVHVNELEKAAFKEKLKATLEQVWDKSYKELKLAPKPKDVFQTAGAQPKPLTGYLQFTLEQAREKKVIESFHFGIASATGGA
jgi:phenylalanyl-tRNA synthetase alpha subunit